MMFKQFSNLKVCFKSQFSVVVQDLGYWQLSEALALAKERRPPVAHLAAKPIPSTSPRRFAVLVVLATILDAEQKKQDASPHKLVEITSVLLSAILAILEEHCRHEPMMISQSGFVRCHEISTEGLFREPMMIRIRIATGDRLELGNSQLEWARVFPNEV